MINKSLYNLVALGGTFDHLHDGHKDFLNFAAQISNNLIIGITQQHMTLQKPFAELIQPEYVRKQAVINFCRRNKIKAKVITIKNAFGPTIEENDIEAIACTTETLIGAEKINEIRKKLSLKELPIHVQKLKKDKLDLGIISAERIRAGEIDRKGNVYESVIKSSFNLDSKMRDYFSKLHGVLIDKPTQSQNRPLRVVVGDSSLENFIKNNWKYDLGIFDHKKKRKKYESKVLQKLPDVESTQNNAGWIQTQAVKEIQNWLNNKKFKHLFVEGEEDLLAVILVLLLPLESYVYYGQPENGLVECLVNEDIKESFFSVLSKK